MSAQEPSATDEPASNDTDQRPVRRESILRGVPLLPPGRFDDYSVLGGLSYELRETFRPPFEILQVIFFNVSLVLAGWFLLGPDTITAERFASLVFLPAVLASWAFSDVPATNLYASQPQRALGALGHPDRLRNLIFARNLTLWCLIAPAGAILSWILALDDNDVPTTIIVAAIVLILPFGFLGITSIVAPLLPYHPMSIKERRKKKNTWIRWGVAVIIPFILTMPSAFLLLLPAIGLVELMGRSSTSVGLALLVTIVWTYIVRKIAVGITLRLTAQREERLRAFLSDPSVG